MGEGRTPREACRLQERVEERARGQVRRGRECSGSVEWLSGGGQNGVAWVDYGEPMKLTVQGELRANRDNLLRELGATHIRTTPISLGGNPGIHFTGETKSILITSRVYVVGSRPYQLLVMTKKRENRDFEIKRFLDSFQLTPAR